MAIDSDIRDQAYQFFIQEVSELLQVLETELLTLKIERSPAKIHSLMRAAHSIKGGAACVGLETIKTLAHRLEDIFIALHNENLEIDEQLESLLLQAYDCLRLPLNEEIATGYFNADQAIARAEPVFTQIEAQLGDFLGGDYPLLSSGELGIDITLSVFKVDVTQELERLADVVAHPEDNEVGGELRAIAEVFTGIGELLNLPEFRALALTTIATLDADPEQALHIAQLALADFQIAQQAVITGDRSLSGDACEFALTKLATSEPNPQISDPANVEVNLFNFLELPAAQENPEIELINQEETLTYVPYLDEVFGLSVSPMETIKTNDVYEFDALNYLVDAAEEALEIELLSQDQQLLSPCEHDLFDSPDSSFPDQETPDIGGVDISKPWNLRTKKENSDEQLTHEEIDNFPGLRIPVAPVSEPHQKLYSDIIPPRPQDHLQELVQSIEQVFDSLPPITQFPAQREKKVNGEIRKWETTSLPATLSPRHPIILSAAESVAPGKDENKPTEPAPYLSVNVDLNRLERMNNLLGELAINRNSLSLQNDQLQGTVQELLHRCERFQKIANHLRDLSDQMLVTPHLRAIIEDPQIFRDHKAVEQIDHSSFQHSWFDALEMDSYGGLHSLLQDTLEEMVQIEEIVGDVALLAEQSNQTLDGQRQMIAHLQNDLMWARMLPLSKVVSRFHRTLRDLSMTYQKPVNLKLSGTGVLVDKAALEKLYDPLLHLVRNAFDHGIETPAVRLQQGKIEHGQIEIRAYHQGSQTIIEVRDDGQGINLERIRSRSVELGLLSSKQLSTTSTEQLLDLVFEPGFSTASQVSELSGRGVGLDVVRNQLRSLKGTVAVTSIPGKGTTFTLRIPLTLTIAKLLVCLVGTGVYALFADSIEEIVIPKADQMKRSGKQKFLHWRQQIVPVYYLSELLNYAVPFPESIQSPALVSVPAPEDWALPMLLIRQDNQFLALEIDRLVTEQELVIKPFGVAIAPPSYMYGCTILGDGSLIPVIDGATVINQTRSQDQSPSPTKSISIKTPSTTKSPLVLIVDDSIALRQTLALTLQKAGYRVLQARDGREALGHLQRNSTIQIVVCDIEMSNVNGFEFLTYHRQDPLLSKIPVVMLSSRSSDKHRRLAIQLGASAYFTKPYLDRELLAALKSIINQSDHR